MKIFPTSTPLLLLIFCMAVFASNITAQSARPSTKLVTKNLVDNQQYIFHAQTVHPMSGGQRFLTSDYTVQVSKDTITSDLPYFGRAFSAPTNPSDGGIHFTSTSFEYAVTPRKKSGWDISIQPKDAKEVQKLILNIFDNGKANLFVNSTNRQPISFYGYIAAVKN